MSNCPTCGQEKLRQALLWQLGRFVPYEALKDVLWGGREDGGPLDAQHILRHYAYLLRKQGHSIETRHGVGLKMQREAA